MGHLHASTAQCDRQASDEWALVSVPPNSRRRHGIEESVRRRHLPRHNSRQDDRPGNEDAAACYNCHGGHDIYAIDDPRSKVHPTTEPKPAARVTRAQPNPLRRQSPIGLTPWTPTSGRGPHRSAFRCSRSARCCCSSSTRLDLFHATRNALSNGKEPDTPRRCTTGGDDEVQRFDGHTRAQHVMMILAFVTSRSPAGR